MADIRDATVPSATATFDPRRERDACGIGFVTNVDGRPRRSVVRMALDGLCGVKHRGAVAADAMSGDGAGLLTQIPRDLVAVWAADAGAAVATADLGVAFLFLEPGDTDAAWACRTAARDAFEAACDAEGVRFVGWRDVPTDPIAIGRIALEARPALVQAIVVRPPGLDTPRPSGPPTGCAAGPARPARPPTSGSTPRVARS